MHPFTQIIVSVALVTAAIYSILSSRRAAKNGLPGPALIPWIGRVHDLPIEFMWTKFKEWSDIYGPIYRTKMLGTMFIIVSDEKIAEDLLVKRAKTFSDRPMVRSLFDSKSSEGSGEYLPLMGKNQYWSRQRKWTHAQLTEAAKLDYHGCVEFEAKRWMMRLLEDPDNFSFTLEDMASKVTCQMCWDDPSLSEYNTTSAWGLLTQMSPAGPITNVLTPLWHLPLWLNPWKTAEYKRHDEQQAWWLERIQKVRSQMEKGAQRPCISQQYLATESKSSFSGDHESSSVIGMLALVGVFTISGPLHYFLMAMVYHPEWQAKCQEEVDRVCGGQMPKLSDYPNLPVIRACIKETMRWKPNVPTGVAHEAEADDFYNGYLIPKGTRILPLDWAFVRNPEKYPDPENFRPERWLEPGWPTFQEPLTHHPTIKGMSSFGWGQRACLGQTLTQDELLVACGGLSWAFNMKFKTNPMTGQKIDIPLNKSNSLLIVKPDPFEMAFDPRSVARKYQVLENWNEADLKDRFERESFLEKTVCNGKA